jgi:zinc/manganese transport system substrate-binding protein
MLHHYTFALFLKGKSGVAMKQFSGLAAALLFTLATFTTAHAADGKIAVVAAENFYGDVAQQIGGDRIAASSIVSNPDQDPHLFEVSPAIARRIADAQIVIYNGADYDPWMVKLLAASPRPDRVVIVAADLVRKRAGDNPHLWYEPATMPVVAGALAAALAKADPAHADDYAARLKIFVASLAPINEKIAALRAKFAGVAVTATEPVFGYMADALALKMRNERLQLAIMNDTEPSARDIAAFERDLKTHKVRALFYNTQASNKLVQHLVEVARAANIPVVGVTETCPPDLTFQEWIQRELTASEHALASPSS